MAWRLTAKAEDDLIRIYIDGVRQFGLAQADRYHDQLEAVFGLIAQNPKLARERHEIRPPVRIHPHGSHVVVYVEQGENVLILRVRHGHEDWESEPV